MTLSLPTFPIDSLSQRADTQGMTATLPSERTVMLSTLANIATYLWQTYDIDLAGGVYNHVTGHMTYITAVVQWGDTIRVADQNGWGFSVNKAA